ncbi:Calcium-transporting ATPase lmo0841 [Mesomycoplasma neurolyticum]|uniref:Calcium-transporting ATPase lmo0841 n=2 Tax=Mesomycoplasma neurolyticum TaxID=2120 RepID=A0A449A4T7_9BACT|nr:Calcium-transporting ATPase lmo0841 [Mesomycoplasma neurolyticum]
MLNNNFDIYKIDLDKGLNAKQLKENKKQYGVNKLVEKNKQSLILKFLKQFVEPLIILLIISSILALSIAFFEFFKNKFTNKIDIIIAFCEPFIILFIVVLNAIFGFVQENKAEKSFDALKKLNNEYARVIRDGDEILILTEELTIGDVILIEAGDKVPAGGVIVNSSNLELNESILTGESEAVFKQNDDGILDVKDESKKVFFGTLVTKGRAKVIITEIGMNTKVGQIANLIDNEKNKLTPLQKKIFAFSKKVAFFSIILCILTFFIYIFVVQNGNWNFWSKGIIIGVTLAIGSIPEGLVPIITMILSISSNKLAKKNALIKKISASETLGSVSIICSDKTGTLTQNKMTIVDQFINNKIKTKLFLEYSVLATSASYTKNVETNKIDFLGDPTEIAILEHGLKNNIYKNKLLKEIEILGEIPFDSERKTMTVFIKKDGKILSISKGAPDIISKKINNFDPVFKEKNDEFASKALRVLAFAIKEWEKMPDINDIEIIENNLTFIGLVAMMDPPRENVKESIIKARNANIKTVMITGDYKTTAYAIAKKLTIINSKNDLVITGDELNSMSDKELDDKIENIAVFARVRPEDKIRIVKAWQKKSHVVAMTGDGVNDAPALKAADIGCAMGITGTDVSKNAADLILTDDNFTTIVTGIKEGRGILYSIKKLLIFLLTTNLSALLITIFGILIFKTNPLSALQILWINVVSETFPGIVLGLNRPSHDLMKNKPTPLNQSIITKEMFLKIISLSLIACILSLLIYYLTTAIAIDNFNVNEIKKLLKNNNDIKQFSSLNLFVTTGIILSLNSFIIKDHNSFLSQKCQHQKWGFISFLVSLAFLAFASYVPIVSKIFDMNLYIEKFWSKQWIIVLPFLFGIIPFVIVEIFKNLKQILTK